LILGSKSTLLRALLAQGAIPKSNTEVHLVVEFKCNLAQRKKEKMY